jgi:hypothetical protein
MHVEEANVHAETISTPATTFFENFFRCLQQIGGLERYINKGMNGLNPTAPQWDVVCFQIRPFTSLQPR